MSRRTEANRRNAQRSTGPKTDAGKRRSGQNAVKHELSRSLFLHSELRAQVDELTRAIAGEHAHDPHLLELPEGVAEAEISLRRARQYRHALMWQAAGDNLLGKDYLDGPIGIDQLVVEGILKAQKAVEQVDRYERRALSRRCSATRRFLDTRGSVE